MDKDSFPCYQQYPTLSFLDNAATTQKPNIFFDTYSLAYSSYSFPAYKSVYTYAEDCFNLYIDCIEYIKKDLLINDDYNILIKESASYIGYYLYEKLFLNKKDFKTIALPYDIHNNIGGYFNTNSYYTIIWYDSLYYDENIFNNVDVVYIALISHVTGNLFPYEKAYKSKQKNQIWIVDACQYAPIYKIDISLLKPDILFFSLHKMYGPYHIAPLIINKNIDHYFTQPCLGNNNVQKMTCGSLAIPDFYVTRIMLEWVNEYIYNNQLLINKYQKYNSMIRNWLEKNNCVIVSAPDTTAIVTAYHQTHNSHDLAHYLSDHDICIRSGDLCAHKWFLYTKHKSYIRFSFAVYNDENDINKIIQLKF